MSHVLVTGGSSGIGAALAARLDERGDEVTVLSRSRPAVGRWVACDLSRPQEIAEAALQVGPVDAVVHSAGIWEAAAFTPDYDFAQSPPAEIARIIAVNLTAPILLTQALLPALARGGRIVLIGSTSGLDRNGSPEVAYGASKAGLRGMADALTRALGGRHPVTLVNPGDVATGADGPGLVPVTDVVDTIVLALALSPASRISELTIEPMEAS